MIKLHHINLSWVDTPEMTRFYGELLGLESDAEMSANVLGDLRSSASAFLDAGSVQIHLSTIDHTVPYKHGQSLNPLGNGGHIAFRTDDLDAVKETLRENGIPYADYGVWSVAGWNQIFFQDPAGTVVEVHQIEE